MQGFNSTGVVNPSAMLAYEDGGPVDQDSEDTDGIGQQGADDATIDPLQFVRSALEYGKRQLGVLAGGTGPVNAQPAMEDGGVVPTGDGNPDGGMSDDGDPNAVNPQAAMGYLAGVGAVSPEIARALEQHVDPQGQLDPAQRTMAAVQAAPNDEARFGMLQHYRSRYNSRAAAAKVAISRGDMGEAAQQATMAMASVPNGQHVRFAPSRNGLVMVSKPLGGAQPAQQQQSFDDGGEVEEAADAPDMQVPEQQPLDNAQNPVVFSPTQVAQLLDDGFDNKIEKARAPSQGSMAGNLMKTVSNIGQFFGAAPPEPPAPTTGSEASTREPEYNNPAKSEAAVRPPEYAETPSATAPVTTPKPSIFDTAPPAPPMGAARPQSRKQGVVPTQTPMERFTDEARQLMPWASQDRARAAYVAKALADARENEHEDTKQQSIERRADNRNQTNLTRQGLADKAKVDLEDRRAQNRSAENDKKQAFQARMAQVSAMTKAMLNENSAKSALLREAIRSNPRALQDPFALQKTLGPLLPGLSLDELKEVGRTAQDALMFGGGAGAPPSTGRGVVPEGGSGGNANDQAADRGLRPGQTVPKVWNGKVYNYVVGNDGRLYLPRQ